jgi:hypothetical protein
MARPWGILAIVVTLSLAGCTVHPADNELGSATNSPSPSGTPAVLTLGSGVANVCADGSAADGFVYGVPVVNNSDSGVYLTSGGLGIAGGPAEIIGMWILDSAVGGNQPDSHTSWSVDYPPDADELPGWSDRAEIADTAIPAHGSVWLAFAIRLTEGADEGTVGELELSYRGPDGTATVTDPGTYSIGKLVDGEVSCDS